MTDTETGRERTADPPPTPEAHALTLEEIRRILISGNGDVRDRSQREFSDELEELYATCARLRLFTESVSAYAMGASPGAARFLADRGLG
jgi:hypothetical protein